MKSEKKKGFESLENIKADKNEINSLEEDKASPLLCYRAVIKGRGKLWIIKRN